MCNHELLKCTYEMETELYRLRQRSSDLDEAVKQARNALREAQQTKIEYGGFRAFLDKLSGKYAGKTEDLARGVRRREAELSACLQEQKIAATTMANIRQQRLQLPTLEELKSYALEEPDTAKCWATLEARLCGERMLPLLERSEQALQEYRQLLRGEFPVLSLEEQQKICAEPEVWAAQCLDLLKRLRKPLEILGSPVEISEYHQSPVYYLMSPAAKHNRLDRAVCALDQVRDTRGQILRLLECLEY